MRMDAFYELPDELLQHIAQHGDAVSLVRLLSVCRRTRAALGAAMMDGSGEQWEKMWLRFAIDENPWLKTVLTLAPPTCSYRELYQRQLLAKQPNAAPRGELSDYVFSAELVRAGTTLASWSSVLQSVDELRMGALLTFEGAEATSWIEEARREALVMPRDGQYAARMLGAARVSVWVTRRKDLRTVCLYRGGAFDAFRFVDERDAQRRSPAELDIRFVPAFEGARRDEPMVVCPVLRPDNRLELHLRKEAPPFAPGQAGEATEREVLQSLQAREWLP